MTKNNLLNFIGLILLTVMTSSCATIVGGTNYYAKVQVPNHPDAKIEYKGKVLGLGEASFKAERKKANEFSVTISKEGCERETINFHERKFRGWAFVGTLVGFTGIVSGVPLPWGVAVDGMTGAWWKPDINEKGVMKQDYNHYVYIANYKGCVNSEKSKIDEKVDNTIVSKAEKLRELKRLLDDGVITEKEFIIEKNKILSQ